MVQLFYVNLKMRQQHPELGPGFDAVNKKRAEQELLRSKVPNVVAFASESVGISFLCC